MRCYSNHQPADWAQIHFDDLCPRAVVRSPELTVFNEELITSEAELGVVKGDLLPL